MTIVFDDEELYTTLKVEAARSHRTAKDIVADALLIFFEATRDEQEAILARIRRQTATPVAADAPTPGDTAAVRLLDLALKR
jgi:hypothetical protein